MTTLARYQAFRAHIEAEIVPATKLGLPVYFGNEHPPRNRPDSWARFTVADGVEDQADTGAVLNTFRTIGVGIFQVFAAKGAGEEGLRTTVDGILAAFRKWRPTTDEIRILRIDVDRNPTPDDRWMRRNVRIDFEHDERH